MVPERFRGGCSFGAPGSWGLSRFGSTAVQLSLQWYPAPSRVGAHPPNGGCRRRPPLARGGFRRESTRRGMKRIILACCGLVLVAATGGCGGPSHHQAAGAGVAGSGTSTSSVQAARSSGTTGGRRSSTTSTTGAPSTSSSTSTSTAPSTTGAAGGSGGSGGGGGGGGSSGGAGAGAGGTGAGTSVVPPVITVAYVDAVFAKLDAVRGNALRSAVAAGKVTQEAIRDYYAVFTPTLASSIINGVSAAASDHFPYISTHPGNQVTEVKSLLASSRTCVLALVTINDSAISTVPAERTPYVYEALAPRQVLNSKEHDPTPWAISYIRESERPLGGLGPCG